MDGTDHPPTSSVWIHPLLVGFLVLYLGGYIAARWTHLLVNYDGHRGWFSVRMFDTSGIVPPTAIALGRVAVLVFFPLHRAETLLRHGPIQACLSW